MSTIKVTNVQNPSAASAAITLDTNGQATLNGLAYPTSGSLSGRNRVVNGSMTVDQRNAGASVTVSSGNDKFPVDRMYCYIETGSSGQFTGQRSTTAPAGFKNSLLLTTSTVDSSIGSTEGYTLQHKFEGYNVADLDFGTANARTVTLSFWVRSSLTGTFAGSLTNGGFNRSYVFTYSISAANTWEYKTVTVAGDTSGTWNTDNTTGLIAYWSLGAGSNYQQTAGAWGSFGYATSGSVNLIGTNGATFYITGVQLEAGSVATPFERRSYGQELMLCQRYCFRWGGYDPGNAYSRLPMGWAGSATEGYIVLPHPVPMRQAARSLTTTAANGIEVINAGYVDTSFTATIGTDGNTDTSSQINISNLSGMSVGIFAVRFYNSAAANFLISAEL